MNLIKRLLKLTLFGIMLFILSIGYRFFGEKRSDTTKTDLLGADEANADVPSCSSTASTAGSTSGTVSTGGPGPAPGK